MPRCTSTNLFASYDEAEAEVESEDLADGTLTAEVLVTRPCAECGEEMASYNFSIEFEVECPTCGPECGGHYQGLITNDPAYTLPEGVLPSDKLPEGHDDEIVDVPLMEIDSSSADVSESGGGRYKKNIFTVAYTASVLCLCCNETFEAEGTDEAAASDFEVLV